MKKRESAILFLLVLILLTPLLLAQCLDSDNGEDINIKGIISGATKPFLFFKEKNIQSEDYCTDSRILKEYYCQDNYVKSKNEKCNGGCLDGKCIEEEPEEEQGILYAIKSFFSFQWLLGEPVKQMQPAEGCISDTNCGTNKLCCGAEPSDVGLCEIGQCYDPCLGMIGDPCAESCYFCGPELERNYYLISICTFITDCVPEGCDTDCLGLDDSCNEGVCENGACVKKPKSDGTSCDDDTGTCVGGTCVPNCVPKTCLELGKSCGSVDDGCGNSLNCGTCVDDGNVCTDDVCNSGVCEHPNNAAPCNDEDACTTGDVCSGGSCNSGTPLICDDGNDCNGIETCDTISGCQPGNPLNCDDGVSCTIDSCSVNLGSSSLISSLFSKISFLNFL